MSLFVIPMAGLSSRFFKAGYSIPKYQLDLHGQSVFRWALSSFERYFKTDDFLFILRDVYQTKAFVESEIKAMGISKYTIIVLNEETRGQAETVYLGLQQTKYEDDLIIFNIDSCRHQYQKPDWYAQVNGYLEVFEGEGEHWSFIEPDTSKPTQVKRTTEKERISHFCSDGLYSFQKRAFFDQAFEFAIQHNQRSKGELYIAPLYNHLISQGLDIRFECVPSSMIDFCGTPDEYQALFIQRTSTMIFINSGAYVIPEFQAELGRIPPCMLPLGNKKLIENQIHELRKNFPLESIYVTLPESYHITLNEKSLLDQLNISIIMTADEFSLAESILYALNTANYTPSDPVRLMYGDTLILNFPDMKSQDILGVAYSHDNYGWQIEENSGDGALIWCGFYSFSSCKQLIQSLALSKGNFIKAVQHYRRTLPLTNIKMNDWHDLGHVNTYFRSRASITTQRAFNTLHVNDGIVYKSGEPNIKILAEASWFKNIPPYLRRFTPQLINSGVTESNKHYYELEYLSIMPLNELFVHGRNTANEWKKIFALTDEFLTLSHKESLIRDINHQKIQLDFYELVDKKTRARLVNYSNLSQFDLYHPIRYADYQLPSIMQIAEQCIEHTKNLLSLPSIIHGDLCFSNMLFDSRSESIKVIDPRGINLDGEISIYGDQKYDLAKLQHSILGLYDFIIAGRYKLTESSTYHFELDFELDERVCRIQQAFIDHPFSHQLSPKQLAPLVVLLFLSMLPLHEDRPDRQRAMLANAVRLYLDGL